MLTALVCYTNDLVYVLGHMPRHIIGVNVFIDFVLHSHCSDNGE